MRFIKKATIVSVVAFAMSACGTSADVQLKDASDSHRAQAVAWDNSQDNPDNLDPSITMNKKFSELPLSGEAEQKP